MKKIHLIFLCGFLIFAGNGFAKINDANVQQPVAVVKNMFTEFSEGLDLSKLDKFYSRDFMLESNTIKYNYQAFKKLETNIYGSLKSLKVTYQDIFASGNKVAARVQITLTRKNGTSNHFYVYLIARVNNGKIDRLWELTYPTWRDKYPPKKAA
jgi:ketosteroid isomerase-like protein